MGIGEIFLIAVGLSMDAFAVSICKGLEMKKADLKYALTIGLFFGGFQAVMPALGYFLGKSFEGFITAIDHWVSFGLLCFIGGKMLFDAIGSGREAPPSGNAARLDYKELLLLAFATSIDALAAGITLAFTGTNITLAAAVIGITAFVFSVIGVPAGRKFGCGFGDKASAAGGIILIAIGTKILLEHLGLLS